MEVLYIIRILELTWFELFDEKVKPKSPFESSVHSLRG